MGGPVRSFVSSASATRFVGCGRRRGDCQLDGRLVVIGVGLVVLLGELSDLVDIPDEPTSGHPGEPPGAVLVPDLLVDRLHPSDEIRLSVGEDLLDAEALGADGHEVEPAIGVAVSLADLGMGPDRRYGELARADLAAIADPDDPEAFVALETAFHHQPVARLEDVKGHGDPRTEDRVQREERDIHPTVRV